MPTLTTPAASFYKAQVFAINTTRVSTTSVTPVATGDTVTAECDASDTVDIEFTTNTALCRVSGSPQVRYGKWTLYRGTVAAGTAILESIVGRQTPAAASNSACVYDSLVMKFTDASPAANQVYEIGVQSGQATTTRAENNTIAVATNYTGTMTAKTRAS